MSKAKRKHTVANVPATTLLRLRLDGLWQNPALPEQPLDQMARDLDTVTRGLKQADVMLSVVGAYHATPLTAQVALDRVLPDWVQSHQLTPQLDAAITHQRLGPEQQATVVKWLQATGQIVTLPEASELFFGAYDLDDSSQAATIVAWYSSPRRNRVRGMSFLIDYNPPWEGALKDITDFPQKTPELFVKSFVDTWGKRGQALTPMGAAEAKRKILTSLACNRAQSIRLPRDLIAQREAFLRHLLTLPDLPDTPTFTAADFDALQKAEQSPEALMGFEQKVGRRIRLEDGKELFVDASIANAEMAWEREGWDEAEQDD